MKLDREAQFSPAALAALAAEAVALLHRGDVDALAQRFGYAVAFDRGAAAAIREDLAYCLLQVGANGLGPLPSDPVSRVEYFKPDNSGLLAVVHCQLLADNDRPLMVDLVVSGRDGEAFLTVEDISVEAPSD
jgi:hypothetical protein